MTRWLLSAAVCGLAAAPVLHTQSPPAAASEEPECLKCHEPMATRLKKKVVHAAVEMGCPACHVEHRKNPGDKSAHHLSAQPPELCLTCHDAKDANLAKAHHGQPFDKAVCTGCHDPHSSDSPKLILERAHGPFAGRQCEGCHQPPENGKVKLAAAANDLCFRCHDEFKMRLEKVKAKHSLLELGGSCVDCHTPHAARVDRFLKKPVTSLCNDCHAGLTENKKFVHEPLRSSCVICHNPHGSNYPSRLSADVNTLCTACHGLRRPTQNSEGQPLVIPAGFPERAGKILLDREGKGHPYMGHPVAGTNANGKLLSCVSCHSPHAGNVVQLFAGDLRGNALCLSCHGKK